AAASRAGGGRPGVAGRPTGAALPGVGGRAGVAGRAGDAAVAGRPADAGRPAVAGDGAPEGRVVVLAATRLRRADADEAGAVGHRAGDRAAAGEREGQLAAGVGGHDGGLGPARTGGAAA